ncbi:MAG: FtsX-like permease family protein [Clostridia bacterium]|nr:FtsX-like permease family protein [Clostridia bacterium]
MEIKQIDLGEIGEFKEGNKLKTKTLENISVRGLAGVDTPAKISVYAKDFESKESIKNYIDAWNDSHEETPEYQITYSDMMNMMFGMLNTMVDAVTYVLVAFTSISLVVSSVMIGIITYISVVERTKEIGILRALGAAKGEVSNVFNAETFLIGLFAGLIGVGVTYLLSIPINIILASLVKGVGNLAVLNPVSALILILVSVALTMIAGLIPSRIAAKNDPVVALRSE